MSTGTNINWGAYGTALLDTTLAGVGYALAGINILGAKPFAFLQGWALSQAQNATAALRAAAGAQSTANTAVNGNQAIVDGINNGVGVPATGHSIATVQSTINTLNGTATTAGSTAGAASTAVQSVTDGIAVGTGSPTAQNNPVSSVAQNIGGITQSTQSVGSQVNSIVQALSQPGYPLWWTAGDPTAEVTFPFALLSALSSHSHTVTGTASKGGTISGTTSAASIPYLSVSSTAAFMGFIRFQTAAQRVSLGFIAMINPNNNASFNLYIDIYQMNSDGSLTLNQSTADLSGQITTSNLQWVTTTLTTPIAVVSGSVLAFNFRVVGSAVLFVPGLVGFEPTNHLGIRPYSFGASYTPSTSAAVTSYTQQTVDGSYSGQVPFLTVGATAVPQLLYWYDDFNRTQLGSAYYLVDSDGGTNAYIYQNSLGYQGYSDGVQAIIYYQPAFTDRFVAGFNIPQNAGATATPAGVGIGCDANGNGGAWLNVWTYNGNGNVRINAGSFSNQLVGNATVLASFPLPSSTVGNWFIAYDPGTNQYTITYPDGTQQQWVDSKNVVTHGQGHRYGAMYVTHYNYGVSTVQDNFSFYDD